MNFYNENDPKAAAWLRELIRCGLIADGIVDERSIYDIKPDELAGYNQCHFFAGIGGWSYALRLAGWPDDKPVWTGSCPCQPFSNAGKGLGVKDERHLWPVFAGLIKSHSPPIVFGEQVASKAGRTWLAGVFADLEAMGYSRAGADLCAAGVGAPHIRQRLFWVANSRCSEHERQYGRGKAHGETQTLEREAQQRERCWNTVGDCSQVVGLADPNSDGNCRRIHQSGQTGETEQGREVGQGDCRQMPESERESGHTGSGEWVEDPKLSKEPRQRPIGGEVVRQQETIRSTRAGANSARPPWDRSTYISGQDGKQRRIPVEPSLFPLANGLPGRVGLLRGAGNAIVPQVAAEFIQAAIEAITDHAQSQPS